MELPNKRYRHDDDSKTGEDIDDSRADKEGLNVDAGARYTLIPEAVDGRTLGDDRKGCGQEPGADESTHTPDGDAEFFVGKGTIVEHEHRKFYRNNSQIVQKFEGKQ